MLTHISSTTLDKFTTFGDLLRFLRRRVGLTQLELAAEVGYSDTQISRLEQNLRLPDIPTIEARFVAVLGLEDEPETLDRLLDLAANVRREDAPAPGLCPYKGLNYYDEADSELFAGREVLTTQLVESVLSLGADEDRAVERFLAVVGASGSGKSSLVRAGLVPSLRWNKNSADWHIYVFTPTARPLESLAAALTHESNSVTSTATLMDDLAQDQRSLQFFTRRLLGPEIGSRLLLVVDQFEELFALCRSEEERIAFIDSLLTASSWEAGPVIVVITLRADFYAHCAGYGLLRKALASRQLYIGAMNDAELRRAIEEGAQRGRWEFEPGLVDLLLRDVGHEPGVLPLLSHALLETWERRRGRTMTLSGYTSSRGVRGAIAETAETVFADQFNREHQAIARRIFLRLTELGDEKTAADTRRRATFDELILKPEEAAATHEVIKALADARLITTSEDSVEVAHEALIREWPTLRGWLEDNREELRLHRQLTEACHEWQKAEHPPDMLYRGLRLSQAQEWAIIHYDDMNTQEREFLAISVEASESEAAEREAQRQREFEAMRRLADSEKSRAEEQARTSRLLRRRAIYLSAGFVLAVIMAAAAFSFWNQSRLAAREAQENERIAYSRELASSAISSLGIDPERSILLALESIEASFRGDYSQVQPEAEEALHRAVQASHIRLSWITNQGAIKDVAFSPDGAQLATAGKDGTARIWDAATGHELLKLHVEDGMEVNSLVYSPDGGRLAAGSNSGNGQIWDAATGQLLLTISGHNGPVKGIDFSTDGQRLVTGSLDNRAIIWDSDSGQMLQELSGSIGPVAKVAFSPQAAGARSAAAEAGYYGTTIIWNTMSGESLLKISGTDPLAYSPDGRHIATGWLGGQIINIWDSSTGSPAARLVGHKGAVHNVKYSPDGTRLATASQDRTARLWDAASGRELLALLGHTASVYGVSFSPDGKKLATGDVDGIVRIWDIGPEQELFSITGPDVSLPSALREYGQPAFHPDGTVLYALVNLNEPGFGTFSLVTAVDALTGREIRELARKEGMAYDFQALSLALDPDGHRLAVGYEDGEVLVVDSQSGQPLLFLSADAPITAIAFSPDSRWLVTPGADNTILVWDAASGEVVINLTDDRSPILDLAFSPDGGQLAAASEDQTTRIWDMASREPLTFLTGHEVEAIGYSPDGTRLVTANSDGTAGVWDAASGQKLLTLAGHTNTVIDLAISSDSTRLATSSADGTLTLWDLESGQSLLTLPSSGSLAFSPDGARLASLANSDSNVAVYLVHIEDLIALARSRLTRGLSDAECQQYLHVDQCPPRSWND